MLSVKNALEIKSDLENLVPIKNIQQIWDAAIKHQTDGDFDTVAMTDIYKRMDPRLTFKDLANVISAVYANEYWDSTKMNPDKLAQKMVQSLGITLDRAQVYASNAMSQWRGILTRKNSTDSGVIPVRDYCLCLDIICNNNSELDPSNLIAYWNSEFWQIPQKGKNFIYVRCQNISFKGPILKPQVQVFYTLAGFNAPPNQWQRAYTNNDGSQVGKIVYFDGKTSGPMEEGDRGASEAFMLDYNPTSASDPRHFCMIATVTSEFFEGNDPFINHDNWNSTTWIMHNGAAAWHNLDAQLSVESTLKFYNQDGRPEKFAFEAHCKNAPEGTVISLEFEDSNLRNLNSGNVKISRKYQVVETEGIVPANYSGDLKVIINTPDGKLLPEGASVEVSMLWLLDHSHDRYLDAADMLQVNEDARASRNIKVPMGSFTFIGPKN